MPPDGMSNLFYHDIQPPDWIDCFPDYWLNSCKWRKCGTAGTVIVARYINIESCGVFAKVFAVSADFATPFSNMKGIWKTLHDLSKQRSTGYSISEDGRILSDDGFSPPSDLEVDKAVFDIVALYDNWRQFPKAPTLEIVRKLMSAMESVDKMRREESHKTIHNSIDLMRGKIKSLQKHIANSEKELNEIYENAADSLNLLEQYGVTVNLDGETVEPMEVPPEGDFTIPDQSDVQLRFVGAATIMRNASGGCLVEMDNHAIPRIGDIVTDPNNGLSAVYSRAGKWEIADTP
jgi:hypothetical protein